MPLLPAQAVAGEAAANTRATEVAIDARVAALYLFTAAGPDT